MTNKAPDEQEPDRPDNRSRVESDGRFMDHPLIAQPAPRSASAVSDFAASDVYRHRGRRTDGRRKELDKVLESIAMRTPNSDVAEVPTVMYLDNTADYGEVRAALEAVLAAFDQKIIMASDPVFGSVWQAFITALKRQSTPERIDDAAGILKAGAQARWHGEPQSQITKAQGEAIAALLATLENTQNALLAFSNILIVKIDGVPLVRELTPEQVEHMQKHPSLYTSPRLALGVLDIGLASIREPGPDEGQRVVAP